MTNPQVAAARKSKGRSKPAAWDSVSISSVCDPSSWRFSSLLFSWLIFSLPPFLQASFSQPSSWQLFSLRASLQLSWALFWQLSFSAPSWALASSPPRRHPWLREPVLVLLAARVPGHRRQKVLPLLLPPLPL